ncbi:TonB-dependent receptor plug domain-containing protein [Rheinheimera texasensis]|uniref:TonB-dependent receptor plug domain-containing protein n=1 Tax=Rheinheimera texasensis TaxID=306205 RepID=UPI000A75BB36|nr:TonB-dependent receptor plug domain-containing protein [Rheinheimera texasensis]
MKSKTYLPFRKKLLSTCIMGAFFIQALPSVVAEEAAAIAEIERITVTTQKRAQPLQDVPVTVSAFNGETLEQLGIQDLDVLSDITPGLVIQEQSPNNPGFVIRGITSDSGSAQAAPKVSVYYNGTDISRSRGSYFELFDIERVEVVKGPQATLFGTAASVGALSVTTRKPQE